MMIRCGLAMQDNITGRPAISSIIAISASMIVDRGREIVDLAAHRPEACCISNLHNIVQYWTWWIVNVIL